MSRYIRPRAPGASVFFTVALSDRRSQLLVTEVAALREAVRITWTERPFQIDAWVVLPDHLHALWTLPEGDADYSTRWRLIKARFSRSLPVGPRRPSIEARQERGVWQRRFWERHIRNEADFAVHVRYCWINPVKHGLVGVCRKDRFARTPVQLSCQSHGSGQLQQVRDRPSRSHCTSRGTLSEIRGS